VGPLGWVIHTPPLQKAELVVHFLLFLYLNPMPLFFDGIIKLVDRNSFVSSENEKVEFFTYYLQSDNVDEPGTLKLNSKQDFTEFENVSATFTLVARPDNQSPKLFRISISKVSPHTSSKKRTE